MPPTVTQLKAQAALILDDKKRCAELLSQAIEWGAPPIVIKDIKARLAACTARAL